MVEQRFDINCFAGARHHKQDGHFAKMLMRSPDHSTIENGFERVHEFFDFGWCNVLAAADDELLQPPSDRITS